MFSEDALQRARETLERQESSLRQLDIRLGVGISTADKVLSQLVREARASAAELRGILESMTMIASSNDGAAPSADPDLGLLSKRERDVLRLLGQGVPTAAIAAELGLSRSTVDTYRERLKTKLCLPNGMELVRRAALLHAKGSLDGRPEPRR